MNSITGKIGLGTVQFGVNYGISNKNGITEHTEIKKILNLAKSSKIELIDTAYGYGNSEEVLGNIGVDSFKIITKFLPAFNGNTIENQIITSLDRLRVKSVYGLLAHRPLDVVENPEIWDYLNSLKENNITTKIGFSFDSPREIELVLKKGFIPDLIQVPFNYLDNRFKPFMISLKNYGCEIHARSTFLQGLFFMNPETLSGFFDEIKPLLNQIQREWKNLPGMLLSYNLQQQFIDKVIIGVNNSDQLIQNIESINNIVKIPEMTKIVRHEILSPSRWPKI